MRAGLFLLALFFFSQSAEAERLRVLATFAPIYSLTKNVAGEAADVEMLLPPSAEPHDFALSPGDLRRIGRADVIVANGLGLESWLDRALQSTAKKGMVKIVAGEGIDAQGDPHVWLDPILAIQEVEKIRDGLSLADPANASVYAKNAANFINALHDLDREIRVATSDIANKKLVTFHQSLRHFAARYGFEIVGVVETYPGREPTPKSIKELRDTILANNVRVIFSEPQSSPRLLDSLSADLKVAVAVIDPMETGEPSAGLYEKVMRSNLKSLMSALHGEK